MMDKQKVGLLGTGIVLGVAIAWFLVYVMGARPTGSIDVGPFEFNLPAATPAQEIAQTESSLRIPEPAPTLPPEPTQTPTPIQPTRIPTPDPGLFVDYFETGIKPEWGATGRNYSASNGKLVIADGEWETDTLGNSTWDDYEVSLGDWRFSESPSRLQVRVRVQDRNNYMVFKGDSGNFNRMDWRWYRVKDGQEQEIPGTDFRLGWRYTYRLAVEVQGNVYRTLVDGEQKVFFADDTYSDGGVKLLFNGWTESSEIVITKAR